MHRRPAADRAPSGPQRAAIDPSDRTDAERCELTWPGKTDARRAADAPATAALQPWPDESLGWNTTENVIIEGDNLDVLKLLQATHRGAVKMIYIDPPYNTGSAFVYRNDFSHASWLDLMYPRLVLARRLLRRDGLLFISIDDREVDHLRRIGAEIFGEDGFVGTVVVQANKRGQTYLPIAKTHEYLLVYANGDNVTLREIDKPHDALPFADAKGRYDLWELRNRNPRFGRLNRPNLFFPIYVDPASVDEHGQARIAVAPGAGFIHAVLPLNAAGEEGCWRWSLAKIAAAELSGPAPAVVARRTRDGKWNIYERSRKSTTKVKSIWTETSMISEQGTRELGALGLADAFDHPKPVALVERCVVIGSTGDDIILDFFAGSGTTAHAVMRANAADGGRRRFILVQAPEPTGRKDLPTIAAVTRERVRRVVATMGSPAGLGFRAYRTKRLSAIGSPLSAGSQTAESG